MTPTEFGDNVATVLIVVMAIGAFFVALGLIAIAVGKYMRSRHRFYPRARPDLEETYCDGCGFFSRGAVCPYCDADTKDKTRIGF